MAFSFTLGYIEKELQNNKKVPIIWNSKLVQNPHMLILGMSGTGKSHFIKNVISQISSQSAGNVRFHILDVHGDLIVANESVQKFSAATECGFNPFVLNTDIHSGGIKNCIKEFIGLVELGGKLGTTQQAVLRQLLLDVFSARGFFLNDPESWFSGCNTQKEIDIKAKLSENRQKNYKEYPTLEDVLKYAKYKQRAMDLGTSNKTIALLDEINKLSSQINTQLKKSNKTSDMDDKDKIDVKIASLKEKCINSFTEYLDGIETGRELDDWKKYDNSDTLTSLIQRLENLAASGIFRNKEPEFDNNKSAWRYEIKSLSNEEKRMFVDFLLQRIYRKRVDGGLKDEVCEFIILDEAAMFFKKESEHIINVIATQARKFGLGLICATQHIGHASDDFLSSVACKCLFTLAENTWDTSAKKLNLKVDILRWVKPRTNVLVKLQLSGEMTKPFAFCRTP